MVLNINAKFEGKLTCTFKNDVSNLANLHQSMLESLKIGTFMASFCLKLKIYRGVMCHDYEEWWKNCRGIDLSVQNWHDELDKFRPEHTEISKPWTLMGCFWPK